MESTALVFVSHLRGRHLDFAKRAQYLEAARANTQAAAAATRAVDVATAHSGRRVASLVADSPSAAL
eukprot:21691-Chlamydomonas_euryale.AAC.1